MASRPISTQTKVGLANLSSALLKLSEKALKASRKAVAESADEILADALTEYDAKVKKHSGKLRASGKVEIDPSGLTGFVEFGGKKAPYAHLVEFGHTQVVSGPSPRKGQKVGKVPAKPFLTPAGERGRKRLAPKLEAILKEDGF